MRSKGLGILLVLAASPAWAQVSSKLVSPPTSAVVSPRQHGTRRIFGLHPDRVVGNVRVSESNNWSGYAVTGSSFTQAKGSWTVPAVDCTADPNSSASFWVGIDGWVDDTVEQTGTDSDCNGESPSYYAWFEFAPREGVEIASIQVSPGDQMSAEVRYDDPDFTVTITNQTTGESFSKRSEVAGAKRASAEWIAEMNGYRLSDFGIVSFGNDHDVSDNNYATDSSTSGRIGDFGENVWESIMVTGNGVDEAVPSSLTSDGTSFTVTWESN
jgi:hypothetical protein